MKRAPALTAVSASAGLVTVPAPTSSPGHSAHMRRIDSSAAEVRKVASGASEEGSSGMLLHRGAHNQDRATSGGTGTPWAWQAR